jgi:hypothetical protein
MKTYGKPACPGPHPTVNSHDDLVAALRLAGIFLKLLADEYDVDVENFTFYDTKVRPLGQVQLQIAAALANAGEP